MDNATKRKIRLEQGLCATCGKNRHVEGKTNCKECANYANDAQRIRYKMYKEMGRCVWCGRKAEHGMTLCESCRQRNNERTKKYRTEEKESSNENR